MHLYTSFGLIDDSMLLKQFPFLLISLISAGTLFLHSPYVIGEELLLKQYAFIGGGLLAGLVILLRRYYLIKTSHLSRICWFFILKLAVRSFLVTYMVVERYLVFRLCVNLIVTFHVLSSRCLSLNIVGLKVAISFSG